MNCGERKRLMNLTEEWARKLWPYLIAGILLVALALRLQHVHDPLLDHPNWRQGDTASIARNFAQLQYNLLYPQTNYNGPPPNYVELELQILPFFAATLYKLFGVHEIFGRLISIAFSVATVGIVGLFARRLYASSFAGLVAAACFAVFGGSVYYGRTFTPDGTMVFFLTAALYASLHFLTEDERLGPRSLARTSALVTLAYLAKPVAVIAVLPLATMMVERVRSGRTWRVTAFCVLLFVPLLVLWLYEHAVASHAEWHWTSGITTLHVLPALRASFQSPHGFITKLAAFFGALGLLRTTMLGTVGFVLTLIGCLAIPWTRPRSPALLWGWLVAGLLYTYVVVTVERVDYYLFPLVPLAALLIGGAAARFVDAIRGWAAPAFVSVLVIAMLFDGRNAVARYYHYNRSAYGNAVLLSTTLAPKTLVVMGHYGPDVLYYIDRFGWEEDPMLWTPFDEESAIHKGARYYISIEDNRLRRNLELCAWLQRFPVRRIGNWPVYQTDLSLVTPAAKAFWIAFRRAERAGQGRSFLDMHHRCT